MHLAASVGFSIEHRLTNLGDSARFAGIWSVMMLRRPTLIRLGEIEGTISSVFGDHTPFVRKDVPDLSVECDAPGEFKIGAHVNSGETELFIGPVENQVRLTCMTPPAEAPGNYAHGHNVEVFNSADYPYCEAEWHSPAAWLRPGDELTFTQEFQVSTRHPATT